MGNRFNLCPVYILNIKRYQSFIMKQLYNLMKDRFKAAVSKFFASESVYCPEVWLIHSAEPHLLCVQYDFPEQIHRCKAELEENRSDYTLYVVPCHSWKFLMFF